MIENENKKLLDIAKEAAVMAGDFIASRNKASSKIRSESGRDIKIIADIQSERIILNHLKGRTDFSILSEERGLIRGKEKELIWIVDPLDGTLNFFRELPFCCVSVGLWKNDLPLLGAVYDFNRSELFSGIIGKGAWLDKHPIKVSAINQKDKAVLCTGFPANTDFSSKGVKRFIEDIQSYKKVRLLGSAALSIVYVAAGMADAYREENIMLWDIAGALPILLSAGGQSELKKGSKINSFSVFVSNGCLKKG